MRIKIAHIIIALLFTGVAGKAQSFMFSPMASSTSTYTMSTSPVMVDGSGKCLVVSSGLSALRIANNGKGTFGEGCVEKAPIATIPEFSVSLNLFPNPTKGLTTIKAAGQFDANLSCQIRIMNIEGKIMMNKMVPMSELKAGFVFDASAYAQGTYVAVIEFMNQRYPVKFIKA